MNRTDRADRADVARVGFVAGAVAVGLVLAGCSDDDGTPTAITQEQYDDEATRLCGLHGPVIAAGYVEHVEDSDAEEAAFYRTDFIPRGRALIHGLADWGFPADKDAEYRESLNEGLAVLQELEDDPFGYIDHRHRQDQPPEEDLLNRFRVALDGADVPC